MPALNFQKRFVPRIEVGDKEHTIRADRKRPFRVGDLLSLYTGMRQKGCRLLMRRTCTKVERITIEAIPDGAEVRIDDVLLDASELEQLARQDGFRDWTDMLSFWDGRIPFVGQIVHWRFSEVR